MQYGAKFVPPTGDDFIHAFNNGSEYRVKVRTAYPFGQCVERWGYVSITAGWQPAFILMPNIRARGSSDTLNPRRDQVVMGRWKKTKAWIA